MNPLFFQLDNWANDILMMVAGIFLVGCAILAAEIWMYFIAEMGLFIYHRLKSRAQQVGLV